jgi:hypothetical protein
MVQLFSNVVLKHWLFEYVQLVEIFVVMVLGSVKDEQCFSIVSFMKVKLKNKLRNHVDLIIKMST